MDLWGLLEGGGGSHPPGYGLALELQRSFRGCPDYNVVAN